MIIDMYTVDPNTNIYQDRYRTLKVLQYRVSQLSSFYHVYRSRCICKTPMRFARVNKKVTFGELDDIEQP